MKVRYLRTHWLNWISLAQHLKSNDCLRLIIVRRVATNLMRWKWTDRSKSWWYCSNRPYGSSRTWRSFLRTWALCWFWQKWTARWSCAFVRWRFPSIVKEYPVQTERWNKVWGRPHHRFYKWGRGISRRIQIPLRTRSSTRGTQNSCYRYEGLSRNQW